jgi:hypothetical protein
MGAVLMGIGFLIGAINLFVTAGHFFSNDQAFLGVVIFLVPPTELVLPWIASKTLGIVSLVSLAFFVVGSLVSKED